MRALLLVVVLAAGAAQAQLGGGFGGSSPSSGGGVSCALSSSTSAFATYFRSTDLTGTQYGFGCDGVTPMCFKPGPGARTGIGTNTSGEITVGPQSGSGTVMRIFGDYISLGVQAQTGTFSNTVTATAAYFIGTNGYIQNSSTNPVYVNDTEGLRVSNSTSLAACSASLQGTIKPLTFAAASGTPDRLCWCRSDNAASPTYRWVNVVTGSIGTTTTECLP